jgi:hypothetical protein
MRNFVFGFIAMLVVAAAPVAALADYAYTFQVPATLNNLPAGAIVWVECNTYSGVNASGTMLSEGQGSGTPANGSYSNTITVKLSSTTKPASYECWLQVSPGGSSTAYMNIQNGLPNVPATGWTGTQFTIGAIP